MYPQRPAIKLAPSITDEPLKQLPVASLALVLCAYLFSYSLSVEAEQNISEATHTERSTTHFHQQLLRLPKSNKASENNSLLQQVTASNVVFDATPIDRQVDDDLAFNYLWMQQYQQDYRHKKGSAAMGKLLRMGVKSIYNTYTGRQSNINSNDDLNHSFSNMDYRLRLSGDKVKLGVEYAF